MTLMLIIRAGKIMVQVSLSTAFGFGNESSAIRQSLSMAFILYQAQISIAVSRSIFPCSNTVNSSSNSQASIPQLRAKITARPCLIACYLVREAECQQLNILVVCLGDRVEQLSAEIAKQAELPLDYPLLGRGS